MLVELVANVCMILFQLLYSCMHVYQLASRMAFDDVIARSHYSCSDHPKTLADLVVNLADDQPGVNHRINCNCKLGRHTGATTYYTSLHKLLLHSHC